MLEMCRHYYKDNINNYQNYILCKKTDTEQSALKTSDAGSYVFREVCFNLVGVIFICRDRYIHKLLLKLRQVAFSC